MKSENMQKKVALILLEDHDKRIFLQLRDNIPHIGHPDHWGFFGGAAEGNETSTEAALREIEEELAITLDPGQLSFLKSFDFENEKELVLFHYPIEDGLKNASLGEGQRFAAHTKASIQTGTIDQKRVVPIHLDMLNWYWQSKTQLDKDAI
ncbi:MAG: NUDIX domain-containing protein [Anaerolineae bacterium]